MIRVVQRVTKVFACKFRELKLQQTFSEVAKKGQMLKKEMYLGHGRLKVRNSEIMDVEMTNISETNQLQLLSFGIARNSTLSELKVDLQKELQETNIEFFCDEGYLLSLLTPIQALITRNFRLQTQHYAINLQGQSVVKTSARLQDKEDIIEGLSSLELPAIYKRQIQEYYLRINTWLEAKHGAGIQNYQLQVPAEAAQSILVQAILDPYYNQVHLQSLQTKWLSLYYEVQDLQAKKKAAEEICSKIVSRRLILGLVPIAANIAFIWSGTYIFYSWDIIEPIAYFISSMAGIVLVSSFRKLQKPYSNANFRQYLRSKYMEKACKQVQLDLEELKKKELQLRIAQMSLKDYLLIKL